MGVALVRNECLRIEFCVFLQATSQPQRIMIYFIDALDSLGNRIYIFIDYNPLLRILGGEMHCRRT